MTRDTAPVARGDVPLGIAAAIVILLVALFVPIVHRTPAWPSDLPPLSNDGSAAFHEHRVDLARPVPPAAPEVMSAWRALSVASARHDGEAFATAQHAFSEILANATEHVHARARAIRARAAQDFLARLDDDAAPLTVIARRHRLAGKAPPVYADRSARLAWFLLRWERLALPTPEQGALEPLTESLLRIPPGAQRAFVAWGLAAHCAELLGATDRPPRPDDPRRCAAFRQDFIAAARGFDRSYPQDEALAATDMLLGLGLGRVATPTDDRPESVLDEGVRHAAQADAQAAFVRARDRYEELLRRTPSRRYERLLMGATAELGREL